MGPHLAVLTTIAFFSWFGGIWQRSLETINVTPGFFEPCLAGDPKSCYWLVASSTGLNVAPGTDLGGCIQHRNQSPKDLKSWSLHLWYWNSLPPLVVMYWFSIPSSPVNMWLCPKRSKTPKRLTFVGFCRLTQYFQIKNSRVTRLPQEAELLVPRFPCAHRPSQRFSSSWSLLRPEAFVAAITHMGSLNSAPETLSANFVEGSSANSKSNKIRLRLGTDPSRPSPMLFPMFRA